MLKSLSAGGVRRAVGKADKWFQKIPSGVIAIVIGAVVAWITGNLSFAGFKDSFEYVGFYTPHIFIKEIFSSMKGIVPYLPVIIPLQINNFLTTLQGVESARNAGDDYPERKSMIMDGIFTIVGSLLGNPFPTTVYFGQIGRAHV